MATLIHVAKAMDLAALERLRLRARKHARGDALGLDALARTLRTPPGR